MKHRTLNFGSSCLKAPAAALVCIAALTITACVAIAPQFMAPDFEPATVDRLTILPVVDARIDDRIDLGEGWELEIEDYGLAWWPTSRHFKRKGYDPRFADSYGAIETIDAGDLAEPTPTFLEQLGGDDERWIFVFALDELKCEGNPMLVKSCVAECSAVLFDKEQAMVVWRHSARTETAAGVTPGLFFGGILGGAAGGIASLTVQRDAIKECFAHEVLYKHFPKKSGSRFR